MLHHARRGLPGHHGAEGEGLSEGRIFRGTIEEIRKLPDETDWARIRAEEAAGVEPPSDPEEDVEVDWDKARWLEGGVLVAESVPLILEADLLAFFRRDEPGFEGRLVAALRAQMAAGGGDGAEVPERTRKVG